MYEEHEEIRQLLSDGILDFNSSKMNRALELIHDGFKVHQTTKFYYSDNIPFGFTDLIGEADDGYTPLHKIVFSSCDDEGITLAVTQMPENEQYSFILDKIKSMS